MPVSAQPYQQIAADVKLGQGVRIYGFTNLYGCEIGDDVKIGTFVEIQRAAAIGKRCKISSHSFVCEGVTIEDEVFIGHGVMFINDMFATGGPAHGNRDLWRATTIGNHVSVGTNATILPVTICDWVVIGAGSVVTKDIAEPGIYAGNPARLLRRLCTPPELSLASRNGDGARSAIKLTNLPVNTI